MTPIFILMVGVGLWVCYEVVKGETLGTLKTKVTATVGANAPPVPVTPVQTATAAEFEAVPH